MIVTVFDEETTGRLKPDHRIIELSMRQCDLRTMTEIKNHLFRFNPERNIDAKAFNVHGITLDELKGEPLFKDRIPDIVKVLAESDLLVGHNCISFDIPFLVQEFERCGAKLPDIKVFDTMVKGTFATDLGKSPTLQELCFSLDIDYDPALAHKGDYDTLVLRDALFQGVKLGWFNIKE